MPASFRLVRKSIGSPPQNLVMVDSTDTSASPDRFADTLRLGQQRGDISSDVDPLRAGLLIFDGYLGVFYRPTRRGVCARGELVAMLDPILAGIARGHPAEGSRKGRRTTTPTRS
jgi:hypothetical protein